MAVSLPCRALFDVRKSNFHMQNDRHLVQANPPLACRPTQITELILYLAWKRLLMIKVASYVGAFHKSPRRL